jgi:hypothetical protein
MKGERMFFNHQQSPAITNLLMEKKEGNIL